MRRPCVNRPFPEVPDSGPVSRFRIDPARSSVTAMLRPALPGAGARPASAIGDVHISAQGVATGSITVTLHESGSGDLNAPAGSATVPVDPSTSQLTRGPDGEQVLVGRSSPPGRVRAHRSPAAQPHGAAPLAPDPGAGVTRFVVDTERTGLDVEIRPSLFGFRMHITGLSGEIEGTLGPDGQPDLDAAIGAEVTMSISELDFGNPLLTRTTRSALNLAGDGSVTGRLLEAERDDEGLRFTFEVESGRLRGRLRARCRLSPSADGSAVAVGRTDFRAEDFDLHLPGLEHVRGTCTWRIVVLPAPDGPDRIGTNGGHPGGLPTL